MSTQRTPPSSSSTKINIVRKRQRITDDDADEDGNSITLNAAVRMLINQFTETRTMIDKMRYEINNKIDAVKTGLEEKLTIVSNDIHSLRAECVDKFKNCDTALDALNGRVDEISSAMENLENRNELILSGIPYLKGEDIMAHFTAMSKRLGMDERTKPSIDIKRLKSGVMNDGDNSLVLVQFALRNQRDEFYSAYLRKRDLQLNHIGFESTRRIYVNENLTVAARKLKAASVRLKKAGKLATVYTKLGVVFVKPTIAAKPIVIQTEEQLSQFL